MLDLINNQYDVKNIYLENAEVFVGLNDQGEPNYSILQKTNNEGKSTFFNLESISLNNVKVHYDDVSRNHHFGFYTKNSKANLRQLGPVTEIYLTGNLHSETINVNDHHYFSNKDISTKTSLIYDNNSGILQIKSGELQIDKGQFLVKGNIDIRKQDLDLTINGQKANLASLISLLPYQEAKTYQSYRSRGEVYFNATVKGQYGSMGSPSVNIDFGASNTSFFHPKINRGIEQVAFTGQFTSNDFSKRSTYKLTLKNMSFVLDNKKIEGYLNINDFNDYQITSKIHGLVDINVLLDIFPSQQVKAAYGKLDLDLTCSGKISDLNSPTKRNNFRTDGEVSLHNVSFILNGERLPFNRFNGSFMFKNNDLAISNFTGEVGRSDFRLNGFFNNVVAYLLAEKKKLIMQADLQSNFIDMDELLRSNFASLDTTHTKDQKYTFRISPEVNIDFNCHVNRLKIKRFDGRNILGHLEVKNRIAVFDDIRLQSMGGQINLSGSVTNRQENTVEILTEASLNHIDIDSIFFVFGNFRQNWLVSENLKGQIYADVNTYLRLDEHLKLDSRSILSDINARINNGELIDFEPMQKLSKFVEEESLSHLRFSEMQNQIRIENRTIYLPKMTIRSNVSAITVSGSHTFDQDIDYHLAIPLKSFIRLGKQRAFAEQAQDRGNLLLKVTGTTSDYKVSYDTKAFTQNIKEDIANEGQEWKDIFEGKKKESQKQVELEDDEYFDFDQKPNNP